MKGSSHIDLLNNLNKMHTELAYRNNASSQFIQAMAQIGKPLNDAVASGLLTLNGTHAPIHDTCIMYNRWEDLNTFSNTYSKVPGYGSAWYKAEPDPVIQQFFNTLDVDVIECIDRLTLVVQDETKKQIYPNAALATAVAANIINLSPLTAMSLVIEGRLNAWVMIYLDAYRPKGF